MGANTFPFAAGNRCELGPPGVVRLGPPRPGEGERGGDAAAPEVSLPSAGRQSRTERLAPPPEPGWFEKPALRRLAAALGLFSYPAIFGLKRRSTFNFICTWRKRHTKSFVGLYRLGFFHSQSSFAPALETVEPAGSENLEAPAEFSCAFLRFGAQTGSLELPRSILCRFIFTHFEP